MTLYNEDETNKHIKIYLETGDKKSLDYITIQLFKLADSISKKNQFKRNNDLEDLIQNAVFQLIGKLHMIDLNKGRSYSYLYKSIYLSFLYDIRKRNRIPPTSELIGIEAYEQDFYNTEGIDLDGVWKRAEDIMRLHHKEVQSTVSYLMKQLQNIKDGKTQDISRARKLMRDYKDYIRYNKHSCINKRTPRYKAIRNIKNGNVYTSVAKARQAKDDVNNLRKFINNKYCPEGYNWEFIY